MSDPEIFCPPRKRVPFLGCSKREAITGRYLRWVVSVSGGQVVVVRAGVVQKVGRIDRLQGVQGNFEASQLPAEAGSSRTFLSEGQIIPIRHTPRLIGSHPPGRPTD
jgi:hypothetical protein